jgi:putative nucleotidyltransferase with HDIG domain
MRHPPRLVVRTLTVTFTTVAVILSVVFIVLTVETRDRVRHAESEKLAASARMFNTLESRRQNEQLTTVATLAENPTLKAALATYAAESTFAGLAQDQALALRATVAREADKLAKLTGVTIIAIVEPDGRVFAAAGPAHEAWAIGERVSLPRAAANGLQGVVSLPRGTFRVVGAPLRLETSEIGTLVMGTSLDERYARELTALSRAPVAITVNGRPVASTLSNPTLAAFVATASDAIAEGAAVDLNGEEHAVRTLFSSGPARIYALSSIDAAARMATRDAFSALAVIALGGIVLAGFGSLWLARTLTDPINSVAHGITTMAASRDLNRMLEASGTSRELDALTGAFNDLMRALHAAEAEKQATYVGAIRALAAALDARDPYTAGHSERVSKLSVAIGQRMALSSADLEVVRLGALLHDIGKIGVPDDILRKSGPLTAAEFEQIKLHPALGARILRQVHFLAPHVPIVELHHERPDGNGYPFGLRGDDIPVVARIVHVADAYDAMTTARAYRPSLPAEHAFAELHRYSGSQFDPDCVAAITEAAAEISPLRPPTIVVPPKVVNVSAISPAPRRSS